MDNNEQLIHHFYTSFQEKNYREMQAYYAENAMFSDPAFPNLNASQVRSMWQMLLQNGKDLTLNFEVLEAKENTVKAHWDASYTFSLTGRKVLNQIDAEFEILNGKIIRHTDHFNFYRWARQAFGLTGVLIGWTPFFQRKVQQKAANNLSQFIKSKSHSS